MNSFATLPTERYYVRGLDKKFGGGRGRAMRVGRDWLAWCLLAVAVSCLGVALFPHWDEWVDPATGDRVTERRLGLWASPLHQSERHEPPQGGFTWRGGVNWLSWSSLLVVAGVVSFKVFRQRLRGAGGGGTATHEATAQSGAADDRGRM